MKRFFHTELEEFRSHLILMAEKSIELMRLTTQALIEENPDLAKNVIRRDDEIDQLEMDVDAAAVRYISLRSPVAGELRLLTTGMRLSHELERVGDESVSIAKKTVDISEQMPVGSLYQLPKMAELSLGLLRDAINSFMEGNKDLALSIPARDQEINELNRSNLYLLTEWIKKTPDRASSAMDLIFISKSYERIADHATNIAEEVIFMLSGMDVRHSTDL